MRKKRKQKIIRISRNIFNLIVIVFLLKSCSSKQVADNCKTEVLKNFYKNKKLKDISWRFTGNVKEGKTYFFKDNGEIYGEFNFKNSFKNGKARTYDSGLVLSEENYVNNKLNG